MTCFIFSKTLHLKPWYVHVNDSKRDNLRTAPWAQFSQHTPPWALPPVAPPEDSPPAPRSPAGSMIVNGGCPTPLSHHPTALRPRCSTLFFQNHWRRFNPFLYLYLVPAMTYLDDSPLPHSNNNNPNLLSTFQYYSYHSAENHLPFSWSLIFVPSHMGISLGICSYCGLGTSVSSSTTCTSGTSTGTWLPLLTFSDRLSSCQ